MMKKSRILTAFVFVFLFLKIPDSVQAGRVRFPIRELGSCRNIKECKLYCEVPKHTPACWSYGKYVLRKKVLGEETVDISYPISELGNCSSATECFQYCMKPENQAACSYYGEKKGLVKDDDRQVSSSEKEKILAAAQKELGCDSKDSCRSLCSQPENMDKCMQFAKKYGIAKARRARAKVSAKILKKAKEELGCSDESSCKSFCTKEENKEKCFAFAQKYKLVREEALKRQDEYSQNSSQMLVEAKKELGCTSVADCVAFCSKEENRDKCTKLGRKHKVVRPLPTVATKVHQIKSRGNCADDEECRSYCEEYPEECPGFGESTQNQSQILKKPPDGFIGPSGCKSEKECEAYCKKHPDQCPGFPKQSSKSANTPGASSNFTPSSFSDLKYPEISAEEDSSPTKFLSP